MFLQNLRLSTKEIKSKQFLKKSNNCSFNKKITEKSETKVTMRGKITKWSSLSEPRVELYTHFCINDLK